MTDNSLNAVMTLPVPPKAIADVLSTVPFDRRNTRLHDAIILTIARKHGGDEMLATAIRLRIQLLGMIIHADDSLEPVVAGLTPKAVGDILAAISIENRLGCLSFDGDALAEAIRTAAEPAHAQ